MTNLRRILGTLFLCALVASMIGCKKDDSASVFTIVGDTSLDFEYGQTKEVAFTANNIKKFDDPTFPEGWTCVRSGNKYLVTAPTAGDSGAAMSGTVELSCVTDKDVAISRKLTVAISIAEEITAGANSIIVSKPGRRFKFDARMRGNETARSITSATSANRVWTTSAEAITNVSYENGYLFFSTGADQDGELIEANAVIAVRDGDNNILWSWHIWATTFDPAADPDIFAGERVMSRNLGAFAGSNSTPEQAWLSYGLYYQWGRKDPFVGPNAWNSTVQQPIYAHSGVRVVYTFGVSDEETGTVEYATAHPSQFIAGSEDSEFDWLFASRDDALWGGGTDVKSLYDPCPKGWKVAPPTIWESFTTTGTSSTRFDEFDVEGSYRYGWTFVGEGSDDAVAAVYYPAAGRRSFSPSLATDTQNFTNVINDGEGNGLPVGFYWSNAPAPGGKGAAWSLAFRSNYINPDSSTNSAANLLAESSRSGGFPLRCVEE